MKHYQKFSLVVSLVLLLGLVFTGLASAEVIHGKGWLYAKGSGLAKLHMSGQIEIIGHGVGTVYIKGAEKIEAAGKGKRVDRPGGGVYFYGYRGKITATGDDMTIKIVSKKIEFTARGKGTAWLRGRGHYETGGGSGDWAPNGFQLEVVEE